MNSNDLGAINYIAPLEGKRDLMELCKQFSVKHLKWNDFEVEFFETNPNKEDVKSAMDLSPLNLAKALQESMPPDDAMLFAATEPVEEKITE